MAWAEKAFDKDKKLRGYRGRYRDSAGKKQWVKDHGQIVIYGRKRDAEYSAQEEEVKARRQAAPSKGRVPATTTWGDWWDMLTEKRTFDATDTGATELSIVKAHLRPRWGSEPLNEITHELIQDWVDEDLKVRPGMSAAYVHRVYSVFRMSIRKALKARVLTASPCVGVTLPAKKRRAKPYVSPQNAELLGRQLSENYRDAIDFGLDTGLRPGELCGLHANRCDLDKGWVQVAEVLVHRRGQPNVIRPYPKDDEARLVPLTGKAISIIRRRLSGRPLTGGCGMSHTDGSSCDSVLVFLSSRGQPMTPNALWKQMSRASTKAKVERRSPYALRRGFATRAGAGGMDVFALASVMGHENIEQTKEYVQQTPEARARLITALGERPQLTVVEGGANRGADPDSQPLPSTPVRSSESAG